MYAPSYSALGEALGFFGKGKNYLDDKGREGFLSVSKYFMITEEEPPADESSESSATDQNTVDVEKMKGVISVINDGKTTLKDDKVMKRLLDGLGQFDIDEPHGQLSANDLRDFNLIIKYFAGDDKKLDATEFTKMEEAVGKFTPNGKSRQSVANLLEALDLFDKDNDKDLDGKESTAFFKVINHFLDVSKKHTEFDKMTKAIGTSFKAGGKFDHELTDKFIKVCKYFEETDEAGDYSDMQKAVDIFDGEDNTIDKVEVDRLINAIRLCNTVGKDSPLAAKD